MTALWYKKAITGEDITMNFAKKTILGLATASLCAFAPISAFSDPVMTGEMAFFSGEYSKAEPLLTQEASQGNGGSAYYLGLMYEGGRGVQKSQSQAIIWFKNAADRGHGEAQSKLGNAYSTGTGVPQSGKLAADWFERAAIGGNDGAMVAFARAFETGKGRSQNLNDAKFWYGRAAGLGNEVAKTKLAEIQSKLDIQTRTGRVKADGFYDQPQEQLQLIGSFADGMTAFQAKDIPKTIAILEPLAAKNDVNSQEALMLIFYNDKNGYQDIHKALKWGKHAANAGRVSAMKTIAKIYAGGEAGAKNDVLAQKWYQKASDAGDKDAAYQVYGLKSKTQRLKKIGDELAIPEVKNNNKVTTPIPKITLGQPYRTRTLAGLGNPNTVRDAGLKFYKAGDYSGARSTWLPLANAGLAVNQLLVAKSYDVEENYKQAMVWYKRAASAKEDNKANFFEISGAQYSTGLMYEMGLGTPVDFPMAAAWYMLATEHLVPNKDAAMMLGIYYYDGIDIPQSDEKALEFLKMGEQDGISLRVQAIILERKTIKRQKENTGLKYKFFASDFDKVTQLLKDAATKNDGEAQYRLGVRYLRGEHVPQSKSEAIKWFKAAAKSKFQGAGYALQQL